MVGDMKFEYKVEGHCSEHHLNELGAQGWELISTEGNRFTFKRAKRQIEMPMRETFEKPPSAAPGAPGKSKR